MGFVRPRDYSKPDHEYPYLNAGWTFPLPEIDMGIELDPEQDIGPGTHWPPNRFTARDERLRLYRQWWSGDFRHYRSGVEISPEVKINYLRRIPHMFGELLSLSPIDIPDTELADKLMKSAREAVTAMMRSGKAWIWWDGETVRVYDGALCYPTVDGGIVLARQKISPSAPTSNADQIEILHIDEQGSWEHTVYHWSSGSENTNNPGQGSIGDIVTVETGASGVAPFPLPFGPRNGNWGTSLIEDLAPVVFEMARRYDIRGQALDRYGRPIATFRVHQADETAIIKPRSQIDEATWDTVDIASQPADLNQQIEQSMAQRLSVDLIRLEDGVADLQYLEPSMSQDDAVVTIQQLHEELRALTGIPSILLTEGGAPSGESLKRQHLLLYAVTSELQRSIHLGFQTVMGTQFDWLHPFEVMEQEAMERMTEISASQQSEEDDDDGEETDVDPN